MPNYIFLDNWVLSDYTKDAKREFLSSFIQSNHYTIIVNSVSFAEMFNPGWKEALAEDRTIRALRFLSQHPCVFIHPHKIYEAEINVFPNRLYDLPVDLELEAISVNERLPTLLNFLRAEEVFVKQGKDIRSWAQAMRKIKSDWLADAGRILEHAYQKGLVGRDAIGNYVGIKEHKEEFLASLDRRHFSPEQIVRLGTTGITLFLEETYKLAAVRMNSLCFWYSYVDQDRSFLMARNGSDIVDFYQISLIPYCSAFTIDKPMSRLVARILMEVGSKCEIFDPARLNIEAENYQA